jgi:predicted nucleotidyltransferase
MLAESILTAVTNFVAAVEEQGIPVEMAVVFGSQVTGLAHAWSDIDLLLVSPAFDDMKDRSGINLLWRLAARIDSRIEPIPCGSRQWREDDSSALIEIARRQGEVLKAAWQRLLPSPFPLAVMNVKARTSGLFCCKAKGRLNQARCLDVSRTLPGTLVILEADPRLPVAYPVIFQARQALP